MSLRAAAAARAGGAGLLASGAAPVGDEGGKPSPSPSPINNRRPCGFAKDCTGYPPGCAELYPFIPCLSCTVEGRVVGCGIVGRVVGTDGRAEPYNFTTNTNENNVCYNKGTENSYEEYTIFLRAVYKQNFTNGLQLLHNNRFPKIIMSSTTTIRLFFKIIFENKLVRYRIRPKKGQMLISNAFNA